ncbi:ROK family protein [Ferrimonas marina]|uniref:Fructokinase n=1 Tax=Ferrimonas marina TaxID=299255 RepID=A0A1M5VFI5_9GAMM|nr:ROK family protein [Ferrimonas marina]SHH73951.1 fructokinase [Ferrimonas marina]
MNPAQLPVRIGVDLGGSKIEVIALDPIGQILWRQRRPTPKGQYQPTLATITEMVLQCEREIQCVGSVGVGIPGVVSSRTETVKAASSTCLNGQPLERDLSQRLQRPVRTANDANCFAVSEAMDGAGRGYRVVFGAILGTGCGAGLAIDGQAHAGRHGIAGEWGHNPLPWMTEQEFPGPECFCGKRGCIERYISGSGLEAQYRRLTGDGLSATEIELRARAGEPAALQIRQQFLSQLARALAHVVHLLDPDCVVLGGGLSNLDWIYSDLPEQLRLQVIGQECDLPILRNQHGDSSGVRGAAWLWGKP